MSLYHIIAILTRSPHAHLVGSKCILEKQQPRVGSLNIMAKWEDQSWRESFWSNLISKPDTLRSQFFRESFTALWFAKLSNECHALWCTWLPTKTGQPEGEQRSTSCFLKVSKLSNCTHSVYVPVRYLGFLTHGGNIKFKVSLNEKIGW